jgi:plant G-box-binding factor
VESLSNENHTLKDELQRLSEECEKLTSENSSIKEELTQLCGPDVVANLEQNIATSIVESHGGDGNS